jgi:hypothetical protein
MSRRRAAAAQVLVLTCMVTCMVTCVAGPGCEQAGGCNGSRSAPSQPPRPPGTGRGRESSVEGRTDQRGAINATRDTRPASRRAGLAGTAGWSLKPLSMQPTVIEASVLLHEGPRRQQPSARSTAAKEVAERAALKAGRPGRGLRAHAESGAADDPGVCMSLPANESMHVEEVPEPEGDPCRWAEGEERWGPSCMDPYFGGSSRCCFSPDNGGTCALCSNASSCASAKAVQCIQRCAVAPSPPAVHLLPRVTCVRAVPCLRSPGD